MFSVNRDRVVNEKDSPAVEIPMRRHTTVCRMLSRPVVCARKDAHRRQAGRVESGCRMGWVERLPMFVADRDCAPRHTLGSVPNRFMLGRAGTHKGTEVAGLEGGEGLQDGLGGEVAGVCGGPRLRASAHFKKCAERLHARA
jgi:hypothetical protein